MTRLRLAGLIVGVTVLAGCGLTKKGPGPNESVVPAQQVDMDPHVLAKFAEEVQEYADLHYKLHKKGGLHTLGGQSTAEEVAHHRETMRDLIIRARQGEKQGEFFKKDVEAAFRRILQRELASADGPNMVKAIKQGNPKVEGNPKQSNPTQDVMKPVVVRVNAIYPDESPFSSVPPSLLLKLPLLPEEVKYRFVGRDLIIRDTEANVILDFIKDAVPDRSIPR